jgi:hypothetical protein
MSVHSFRRNGSLARRHQSAQHGPPGS